MDLENANSQLDFSEFSVSKRSVVQFGETLGVFLPTAWWVRTHLLAHLLSFGTVFCPQYQQVF